MEGNYRDNKEKMTGIGLLWIYAGNSFCLVPAKKLYLFLICVKKFLFSSTADAVYFL